MSKTAPQTLPAWGVRETAMNQRSSELIEDISAASAAYLWNILPEIAALPGSEGFERLCDVFRTAFIVYFDARNERVPEPATPKGSPMTVSNT